MNYKGFSWEKFRAALALRNISERQFVKHVYGDGTRMGVSSFFKGNFGIDKLLRACNYLGCRPDDLLEYEDEAAYTQSVSGHHNNVNSMVFPTADTAARAENATLKLLINEKDARIADLQRTVSYLAHLTTLGQASDTPAPPPPTL